MERFMKPIWKRTFNILAVLALIASILAVTPRSVQAAGSTIIVNVTEEIYYDHSDVFGGDPTYCSLREAIYAANHDVAFGGCVAGSGVDTILLPAGTIKLSLDTPMGQTDAEVNGDLDIIQDLAIAGRG